MLDKMSKTSTTLDILKYLRYFTDSLSFDRFNGNSKYHSEFIINDKMDFTISHLLEALEIKLQPRFLIHIRNI